MSYRPVRRTVGATALAVLLTTAAALPAAAAPSTADLPSEILTAMQRDLGLTATQAGLRIAAEEAAAHTEQDLRARLGASFAGAWFDPVAGALVVGTTDASAESAIRAAGAQPLVAQQNEDALEEVQEKLDEAAPAASEAVGSWFVDPATNSVVVTTTEPAAAADFVADAGAAQDPVRVEVVAEEPRLFADLVGGEAIYASNGGRCSIGFSARSGSTAYVVTAGHCTEGGGTWSGYNRVPIGPVAATAFPGDDFGTIRVNSTTTWRPTSRVAGTSSVLGSTEVGVGASVCRSGSTTGYRCGVVRSKNATVNYGGGDIVRGLTGTSACAEPGDSGGSFVSGRQAQGMTSGGSGNCRTGGQTFFQPVNEALGRYGLTLVTG